MARAIRLSQKDKINMTINERKTIEFKLETTIKEIREKLGEMNIRKEKWNKMEKLKINLNYSFESRLLKDRKEITKEEGGKRILEKEWELLKEITCRGGGILIKKSVNNIIESKKVISRFERDKKEALWIYEEKQGIEIEESYLDGSCKEGKAAFGVWGEKMKERKCHTGF